MENTLIKELRLMKLTKEQLTKIIKEEVDSLKENPHQLQDDIYELTKLLQKLDSQQVRGFLLAARKSLGMDPETGARMPSKTQPQTPPENPLKPSNWQRWQGEE